MALELYVKEAHIRNAKFEKKKKITIRKYSILLAQYS
jgi:hypothetical protein